LESSALVFEAYLESNKQDPRSIKTIISIIEGKFKNKILNNSKINLIQEI
jgi:hypothetical protein